MFAKITGWMKKYASELTRSAMVSLLISGTVLYAVLTVFLGNISDFLFTFQELVGPLLVGIAILFLGLFTFQGVFRFVGEKVFSIVNLLCFTAGVYLYLQSNYLIWDIGVLLGDEFWWEWQKHGTYTLIELACILVLMVVVFVGRSWISKHVSVLSGLILLIGLTGPLSLLFTVTSEKELSYKDYSIDRSNEFCFGTERNVILLIIDAFPNVLLDAEEQEYPGTLSEFQDFTRYQKFICENPLTHYAMPAMLTGTQIPKDYEQYSPEYAQTIQKIYSNENSVPKVLHGLGFQVETYCQDSFLNFKTEFFKNITPKEENKKTSPFFSSQNQVSIHLLMNGTILRLAPIRIKGNMVRAVSSLEKVFLPVTNPCSIWKDWTFYDKVQRGVKTGEAKSVFKYFHLEGVHRPFHLDENCNESKDYSREGYFAQGKACLRIAAEFLEQLKKQGIYDNSLIIIAGDHGRLEKFFGLTNLPNGMNPMLLVKMPDERHEIMKESQDYLPQTEFAPALIQAVSQSIQGNEPFYQNDESRQQKWKAHWDKLAAEEDSIYCWKRQKVVFSPLPRENTIPPMEQLGKVADCYMDYDFILKNHLIGFTILPWDLQNEVVYPFVVDSQGKQWAGDLLTAIPLLPDSYCPRWFCCFEMELSPELPDGEYTLYFRYQLSDGWYYSQYSKKLKKQGNKVEYVSK